MQPRVQQRPNPAQPTPGPSSQPNTLGAWERPLEIKSTQPIKTYATFAATSTSMPNNNKESENEASNDWQQQRHERRKQKTQGTNNRIKTITGLAPGTQVKSSGGPNRDLWVFNVHKDMKDDDLYNFIADGGSKQTRKVNIRQWHPRYKEHYEHKCFRLVIGKCDYDYVFDEEFWPLDISVRKYWLSKEERQDGAKEGTANPTEQNNGPDTHS